MLQTKRQLMAEFVQQMKTMPFVTFTSQADVDQAWKTFLTESQYDLGIASGRDRAIFNSWYRHGPKFTLPY